MIRTKLKYALLICMLQIGSVFFVATTGFAQNTSEVGIGLGATNYKGEISPNYRFLNNRPALTAFYKKDVSKPLAVRGSLLLGMMRAHDEDIDLPLNQFRQADMKTNLLELSAGIDYNFLDYYDQHRHIRWSPYFFAGVAVANFNNKVIIQDNIIKPFENGWVFSIPAGLGVKYALSYHWNLGVEVAARKTIMKAGDRLDYLPVKDGPDQELSYTNPYDKDWYFYNGISISYTFYRIVCPDVYKKNSSLLR